MLVTVLPSVLKAAILQPCIQPSPSRYDFTVRVARYDGHLPDPAAFAAAASPAASSVNASVISAHTAGEIICVVCVAAPGVQRRPALEVPGQARGAADISAISSIPGMATDFSAHGGVVMYNPRVFAIYWGRDFGTPATGTDDLVQEFDAFSRWY